MRTVETTVLGAAVTALLAVLAVLAVGLLRPGLVPGVPVLSSAADASGTDLPPLPDGLSDVPLATPAPPPAGEGGYALLNTEPGEEPVRWDPCRPIAYVVDARSAPPGADFLLADALAEVQRVTGLVFTAEGATDERPSSIRRPHQPERYGDRWAPVLVSWSDPVADSRLAGDVAGYAGPQAVGTSAPKSQRYVTGQVVLDGPQLAAMAAGPAGLARARAVVLHELAHLVGLDHVDDPAQLLHPSTTPLVVDFSDGDLRGLAALSGGPCHRDF